MRVLAVVLIVLEITTVSIGCSCRRAHFQDEFCTSNFVVHVLPIQDLTSGPIERTYRVFVIEVFKDVSGEVQQWSIKQLVTPFSSAACGITLTLFTRYIVKGSIDAKGRLAVYSCNNLDSSFTSIDECTRALMDGTFGHDSDRRGYDCSCRVTFCAQENCPPPDPNECVWNLTSNDKHHCQRHSNGQCTWEGC